MDYIILLGMVKLPGEAAVSLFHHLTSSTPSFTATTRQPTSSPPLNLMSSRKRSHPEDDSAPVIPRVLASREMFFSIPLRTIDVHNQPLQAFGAPLAGHVLANSRVADTNTVLNGLQRASLTAVLAVLNDYFPHLETTRGFTQSVADVTGTNDATLASYADAIDMGLIAFLAKHSTMPNTDDASSASPGPDITNSTAPDTKTTTSSTTAVPPKRARLSKKSGLSSRG